MSAWTGRFSYEIQFEAADANEANEAMQRILDAETVFGFPITGRTGVYVAQIVPRDEDSNQDTRPS